jgi:hypothetical protein
MAGNLSIETCGNLFAKSSTKASSNYGIGSDGRIALYVEEKDRSWCTSSSAVDNRAVTIEVASEATSPYKVTDKAYKSLIKLLADICKRNGIKKLLWKGDKSLMGQVDKQNMVVHRWTSNKACPGDYLYNLHGQIAKEVNTLLGTDTTTATTKDETVYRVRKTWKDADSQLGAYYNLSTAKSVAKSNKGYCVFDNNGKQVYPTTSAYSGGFPIIPPVLKINTSGLQVQRLQKFLNWYGGYKLTVDGAFGNKTYLAVLDFQKKEKLTIDGKFGTSSLNKAKTIKK